MNPMNDGGNGGIVLSHFPLCREQFDHASKDFLSQLGELYSLYNFSGSA